VIDAESLRIIPPKTQEKNDIDGIFDFMPSPELMKAFGVFLPRIMKKKVKLDTFLVPEDSVIRQAVEKDSAEEQYNQKKSSENELKMKNFVKSPGEWKGNGPYSGLTRELSFEIENICLNKLAESYNCVCGFGQENLHFPVIVDSDKEELKITMNNCGEDLSKSSVRKDVPSPLSQISCIIDNLENANVFHLDFNINGKNLCFLKETDTLVLIDFDVSVIKDENGEIYPKNDLIENIFKNYINPTYRECILKKSRRIFSQ